MIKVPLRPVPFARELAEVCEAEALEIEDCPRNGAPALTASALKSSPDNLCHEALYAALREIKQLAQRPLTEVRRLRTLAKYLRLHDNGDRL